MNKEHLENKNLNKEKFVAEYSDGSLISFDFDMNAHGFKEEYYYNMYYKIGPADINKIYCPSQKDTDIINAYIAKHNKIANKQTYSEYMAELRNRASAEGKDLSKYELEDEYGEYEGLEPIRFTVVYDKDIYKNKNLNNGFQITSDGELKKYFGTDKNVITPECVKKIGYHAFYECNFLINVTIGENVTHVAREAFDSCSSLESITIEGNPKFTRHSFIGCHNLKEIIVHSEEVKNNILANNCDDFLPEGCDIKIIKKELDKEKSDSFLGADYIDGKTEIETNFTKNNVSNTLYEEPTLSM